MTVKTFFTMGALLVLLASCSNQKYLASKWQQSDNLSSEAGSAMDFQYDADQKLFYKVSNDSTNLYVHIKAVDQTVQKKLMMAGLTVWIDTLAKNKKQYGIKFPIKNDDQFDQMPQRESQGQKREPDFDVMKQHLKAQFFDIELTGFTGKGSREIIPAKSKSISAEMYFNKSNHIFYSYKIPYESIGLVYTSGKLISINLESGALSEENRPGGMQSGMSGGMSGGGPGGMGRGQSGGMGGGGMGGGMGGGRSGMQGGRPVGMPDRSEMTAVIKIKLKKVKLL